MELAASAERKTPTFWAEVLSFVLHAVLAASLFYFLPEAGRSSTDEAMSLSLLSLALPKNGVASEERAVSEKKALSEIPAKTESERPAVQKKAVHRTAKKRTQKTDAEKLSEERMQSGKGPEKNSGVTAGRGAETSSAIPSSPRASSRIDVPFGRPCGPAFTRFSRPVYPLQARRAGISGLVKLRVSLDDAGAVRDIEVLESGHHLLTDAACTAIRRSSFRPYTENGKSLPSRTVIPIRFSLEQAL